MQKPHHLQHRVVAVIPVVAVVELPQRIRADHEAAQTFRSLVLEVGDHAAVAVIPVDHRTFAPAVFFDEPRHVDHVERLAVDRVTDDAMLAELDQRLFVDLVAIVPEDHARLRIEALAEPFPERPPEKFVVEERVVADYRRHIAFEAQILAEFDDLRELLEGVFAFALRASVERPEIKFVHHQKDVARFEEVDVLIDRHAQKIVGLFALGAGLADPQTGGFALRHLVPVGVVGHPLGVAPELDRRRDLDVPLAAPIDDRAHVFLGQGVRTVR